MPTKFALRRCVVLSYRRNGASELPTTAIKFIYTISDSDAPPLRPYATKLRKSFFRFTQKAHNSVVASVPLKALAFRGPVDSLHRPQDAVVFLALSPYAERLGFASHQLYFTIGFAPKLAICHLQLLLQITY